MADLVRIPLEGGGSLAVEVDPRAAGVVKAGRGGQLAEQAVQTVEGALAALVPGATAVADKLRAAGPSDVSLTFGIKFTAEAGAVIAKTTGECNFAVTMHWERPSHGDG